MPRRRYADTGSLSFAQRLFGRISQVSSRTSEEMLLAIREEAARLHREGVLSDAMARDALATLEKKRRLP